jgi:energy-converting hydrogenase Eha subunit G
MREEGIMGEYICPVCRGYGVTAREKLMLYVQFKTLNCHRCGASLSLSLFETLMTYLIMFGMIVAGQFLSGFSQLLVIAIGVLASVYWHMQHVPLVETGRHVRTRR